MGALGKILATTDLQEKSAAGLNFAASLARDYGSQLEILHVMSVQDVGDLDLPTHDEQSMGQDAQAAGESRLAAHLAEALGADAPPYSAHAVFGSPAMAILEHARAGECDAIVITVSTRSRVGKLLLGSDTLEMLTITDIPVIVVPVAE